MFGSRGELRFVDDYKVLVLSQGASQILDFQLAHLMKE